MRSHTPSTWAPWTAPPSLAVAPVLSLSCTFTLVIPLFNKVSSKTEKPRESTFVVQPLHISDLALTNLSWGQALELTQLACFDVEDWAYRVPPGRWSSFTVSKGLFSKTSRQADHESTCQFPAPFIPHLWTRPRDIQTPPFGAATHSLPTMCTFPDAIKTHWVNSPSVDQFLVHRFFRVAACCS